MKKILLMLVSFLVIIISLSHAQMAPFSNYFYNYYFDYPFFSNGSVWEGNFFNSSFFPSWWTYETRNHPFVTFPNFGYYSYEANRGDKSLGEDQIPLEFRSYDMETYDRSRLFNVPFINFNETDLGGPISLTTPAFIEENNICNPESPLYYLNPLSPYYGRPLPTKGTWFD